MRGSERSTSNPRPLDWETPAPASLAAPFVPSFRNDPFAATIGSEGGGDVGALRGVRGATKSRIVTLSSRNSAAPARVMAWERTPRSFLSVMVSFPGRGRRVKTERRGGPGRTLTAGMRSADER